MWILVSVEQLKVKVEIGRWERRNYSSSSAWYVLDKPKNGDNILVKHTHSYTHTPAHTHNGKEFVGISVNGIAFKNHNIAMCSNNIR